MVKDIFIGNDRRVESERRLGSERKFESDGRKEFERRKEADRRKNSERRDNHRINYPEDKRPKFVVEGGATYWVIDISEMGVKLHCARGDLRNELKGKLLLICNSVLDVEGTVVRIEGKEVCLQLKQIIPVRILLEEKRFLHRGEDKTKDKSKKVKSVFKRFFGG